MLIRACLSLLLLVPIVAWPQADTTNSEADTNSGDAAPMRMPPPVSGAAYSTAFTSETQSNNLRAGVTFGAAYSNNVQWGTSPISDMSYTIWPTLALDATTSRMHWDINYAPGFTFYQRTNSLDQGNQNVGVTFQYRLSPHITVSLRDSFQKTSNPFNQPNPLSATPVSGSAPTTSVAIIAPYADQISNGANAQLSYQFRANGMVGVTGTFSNLWYPNPGETPSLFNSNSTGGSAFYSSRALDKYYIGASYQYLHVLAYRAGAQGTQTQIQTVFLFGSVYLKPTLSLSLSAGPQYYDATQAPLPPSRSWSPFVMVSLGWQGQRTSLAASYSRLVTSGGGLAGAYHSNNATISGGWQLSRTWNIGLSANYSLNQTLTPNFPGSSSGGHTISETVSVQHPLGEHLTIQAGYTRIQQSYAEIASVSAFPDTNREFVSISYQFARPLKR